MTKGGDSGVHTDTWREITRKKKHLFFGGFKIEKIKGFELTIRTNSGNGHVHEMGMLTLRVVRFVLQSLQEFQKNLLGDFTPSSF